MSGGRRSERRGELARGRAATRVRCETGNPRRGAPPPRRPQPRASRALAPLELESPRRAAPRAGPLHPPRPRSARAHVWLRPGRGCARSAAGVRPRRGFKCIPRAGARGAGSELSPARPPLRSPASAHRSRDPSPRPSRSRWAAGLGQRPGRGVPKSNVEAPPGKEVRLPLHAAPSGIWNRQEIARAPSLHLCKSALALLKRSSSHQSLASPSPRKPRAD
ncbi:uncharacterized protein LOC130859238 [Hippopotamus amphibius kiboko]|uniref:uncharacterized protein LOC130859238 n=1 Tax=Hippopotamus amphibius kiboko TaxID=575201 RepID=UPI0025966B11|nr:uncharacterized protein LOC130859238 [Hippopotamus amphibius kiboko]